LSATKRLNSQPLTKAVLKCIIKFNLMIVCMCYPASNRDIDAVIDEGARTVEEIGQRCRAGTGCGMCQDELRERLQARGCGSNGATRDCASDLVSIRSR
jgi:bacterioferritin-associated ferredoxin